MSGYSMYTFAQAQGSVPDCTRPLREEQRAGPDVQSGTAYDWGTSYSAIAGTLRQEDLMSFAMRRSGDARLVFALTAAVSLAGCEGAPAVPETTTAVPAASPVAAQPEAALI